MGACSRHFKALMIKNFIGWKRTPWGSICEIFAPMLLMLILVWARFEIEPETIDDYSLYSLRHPVYPVSRPRNNDPDGKFTWEIEDLIPDIAGMDDFMKYADYTNIDSSLSIPVNVTNVLLTLGYEEEAMQFSNFSENVENWTNITYIWNETNISNLTNTIQWEALQSWVKDNNLSPFINVTQLQVLIDEPEKTLAEALDMINVDFEDIHAYDLEALEIGVPIRTYIPVLDPLGPYLFYPPHCYQGENAAKRRRYSSPVIAYVRNGNQIEEDLVDSLQAIFELQ